MADTGGKTATADHAAHSQAHAHDACGCGHDHDHHHHAHHHHASEPIRVQKIGRNESCPCGSGKKYKKCCLAEARA